MPVTWNELYLHCSKHIIFIPWYWVHSRSTIVHLLPLLILTFPFPTFRPEWSRFHSLFSISSRLYFPDIDSWDWLLDPNDDRDQSGTMKAWWFHNAQRSDVGARRHFFWLVILTLIAILFAYSWFRSMHYQPWFTHIIFPALLKFRGRNFC